MQHKKNTKRQTHGPTGLCELFLLTVPIEEIARCQYKTVQIIFPLNLQTITITLDVKRREGDEQRQILIRFANWKEYRSFQHHAQVSVDDFALADCFVSS